MCPNNRQLSAFYDHELSAEKAKRISEHLLGCSRCRERLSRFQSISRSLQALKSPVSSATQDELWNHIQLHAIRSPKNGSVGSLPLSAVIFSVAAAVFLAVASAAFVVTALHPVAGSASAASALAEAPLPVAPECPSASPLPAPPSRSDSPSLAASPASPQTLPDDPPLLPSLEEQTRHQPAFSVSNWIFRSFPNGEDGGSRFFFGGGEP